MAANLVLTNGELLAKARKDAGLQQSQLAELVGVSEETVSRWERNISDPTIRQLKVIEEETGATWLWVHLRRHVKPLDLLISAGVNR